MPFVVVSRVYPAVLVLEHSKRDSRVSWDLIPFSGGPKGVQEIEIEQKFFFWKFRISKFPKVLSDYFEFVFSDRKFRFRISWDTNLCNLFWNLPFLVTSETVFPVRCSVFTSSRQFRPERLSLLERFLPSKSAPTAPENVAILFFPDSHWNTRSVFSVQPPSSKLTLKYFWISSKIFSWSEFAFIAPFSSRFQRWIYPFHSYIISSLDRPWSKTKPGSI